MFHACLLAYGRKQNRLRWKRKESGSSERRRREVGGG